MKRFVPLFAALLATFAALLGASCSTHEDFDHMVLLPSHKSEQNLEALAARYPSAGYAEVMERAKAYSLKGATVAYFGASLANNKECDVAKEMLANALQCKVVTYGYGGYAFGDGNRTLKTYADQLRAHDVYILFATTNDYFRDVPLGLPTDYTAADGFDGGKTASACGGLNYILQQIRRRNPKALVVAFNCPKFFNAVRSDGMDRSSQATNGLGLGFHDYLDAYEACFRNAGVPCLDQWAFEGFTPKNWMEFYMEDGVHLNENGYFLLGILQLNFLLDHLTPQ